MPAILLVDVASGATVGAFNDEYAFSDATTAEVFRSIRDGNGWDDDRTFDALAAGWSDGTLATELDEAILDELERAEGPDEDEEILRAFDRERLHHWWTRGKGLAKWAKSRHPFTTLYRHLRKYVGSLRAKRMAAQWVHEVEGLWPGSDAHRVLHGGRPRGSRVGPG